MPDRPKCTFPRPDLGDLLFRHTFLWRLTNPRDRETLIRLGEGFNTYMYELGCWGEDDPPWIPSMAGALADDVESLAAYARAINGYCEESPIEREDRPVCRAALSWAEKLVALAVEIRTAESVARGTA